VLVIGIASAVLAHLSVKGRHALSNRAMPFFFPLLLDKDARETQRSLPSKPWQYGPAEAAGARLASRSGRLGGSRNRAAMAAAAAEAAAEPPSSPTAAAVAAAAAPDAGDRSRQHRHTGRPGGARHVDPSGVDQLARTLIATLRAEAENALCAAQARGVPPYPAAHPSHWNHGGAFVACRKHVGQPGACPPTRRQTHSG
jgi:hypothetical protein